ncbi:MAG TPA: GNAT family N-acetyltransferase [Rhizomicrobium sp.]
MIIETERLLLRSWREDDRADLARMCADPDVMWDYGQVFTQAESNLRFDRYSDAYRRLGYCRWAVAQRGDGRFLGHCGIMPVFGDHPLSGGVEIGWRFTRAAWGKGYASEAARAALRDGFERCGMTEVWSYTASDNARSEAVMRRIGLARDTARDYFDPPGKHWIVYAARR